MRGGHLTEDREPESLQTGNRKAHRQRTIGTTDCDFGNKLGSRQETSNHQGDRLVTPRKVPSFPPSRIR